MKQLAIVLIIILVTSLTGMAQAEMRVVGFHESTMTGMPDTEYEETLSVRYYLDIEMDRTGETKTIEVDKDTYDMYLDECEAEKVHHDNLWYVKTCNWCAGAFNDAVDWIMFWN